MSLINRLVKARTTEEPFETTSIPWFGSPTKAGVTVNRDRALQHSAVWACIRLRAETIATLPVGVVAYDGQLRHPVDPPTWLEKPNPETTRYELFERTSASLDADGNAFWYLMRDRLDRIREVWVLPPANVQVYREKPKRHGDPPGPRRYRIGNEELGADEILHIPGFTLPGRLRGMNPIEMHAHALGLSIAAEEFGETFFGNGAVMSGVIESEKDPGEPAVRRMQAGFEADHRGVRNAHRPGFLFGGAKWKQLTIPNEAAQFLETRKFQIAEIARIFRVPPHKIGDLERATFSNIEHQGIEWGTDGVLPYTARIESAVHGADGLIEPGQRLRFNLAGLARGDLMSRYAAYAIGRQWGWFSADDIRALEDLNPLPDGAGQTYLEPLNMVPAGSQEPTAEASAAMAAVLRNAGIDPALVLPSATGHDRGQED